MEERLNRVVKAIAPSGIRRFFDIVSQMEGAVALGVGEPDFDTPGHARDAAIYAIEQGKTHYTSNWGTKELRRAVSDYLRTRYEVDFNPDNETLITVGASEGIDLVFRALLNPGDEVLIPDPSYVSYAPAVTMAGGVVVPVKTTAENSFAMCAEDIAPLITPRTKALLLPYPNNPTGAVLGGGQVERLARFLKNQRFFVVTDEIYAELTYTGERHVSLGRYPFLKDRLVLLSGFSKNMAMTGWRIGYACGPKDVMELMFKIHQFTMLCAPVMAQEAALAGILQGMRDGYADIERMRREYNRRRRLIVARLNNMGLSCFNPQGAFYAFPRVAGYGLTSQAFCEELLAKEKLAIVPGDAFGAGGEGYARCSYAYSIDEINEALRRLERFVGARKAR